MKTVLITGANRGIGLATAEVFFQQGYGLILTARDTKSLKKAVAESAILSPSKKVKGRVLSLLRLDVTENKDAQNLAKTLEKDKLKVDVLVNNAGIGGPTPMRHTKVEKWAGLIDANLTGLFRVTDAVLPFIPKGGAIINFSSVLGRFGVPGYTAYCASKHGVIGFTRALALELASKNISVNAVCPGWVDTRMAIEGIEDMARGMKVSVEDARKEAEKGIPMGKFLEPQEVGELVAFLASPAARNMTGQAITLDGGQVMQ